MGKIAKTVIKKTIDKLKNEKAARRKRRIERYGETGADAVEMGHLAAFVGTAGALDYRQRKKEKKAKQEKNKREKNQKDLEPGNSNSRRARQEGK